MEGWRLNEEDASGWLSLEQQAAALGWLSPPDAAGIEFSEGGDDEGSIVALSSSSQRNNEESGEAEEEQEGGARRNRRRRQGPDEACPLEELRTEVEESADESVVEVRSGGLAAEVDWNAPRPVKLRRVCACGSLDPVAVAVALEHFPVPSGNTCLDCLFHYLGHSPLGSLLFVCCLGCLSQALVVGLMVQRWMGTRNKRRR